LRYRPTNEYSYEKSEHTMTILVIFWVTRSILVFFEKSVSEQFLRIMQYFALAHATEPLTDGNPTSQIQILIFP
jgi:hypothetical protein